MSHPAEVAAKAAAIPIRSFVHVGADEGALAQAVAGGADALFLDLEEPQVPYGPKEKQRARALMTEYLGSNEEQGRRPLAFVRVPSPWTGETIADLQAVLSSGLAGVILPKTSGPNDVVALDAVLGCVEVEMGLPMGRTQIIPFLETAQSIRLAYDIAIASPRVTYMGGMVSRFGDVHRALGYHWTPGGQESLYLRSKVLVDARAAGIRYPISGAWGGAPEDFEGLRSWGEGLRGLGYYGMLVSPSGIEVAHEVFTPTLDEIESWRKLVADAQAAESTSPDGRSDVSSEKPGDMHLAYVESAQANLEWARQLGL